VGMKIFVTGGHGFIGSRVVHMLIQNGHEVRCLVRATSKTHRIDGLAVQRFVGDVRDKASLVEGMKGTDACIHLASVSSWNEIRSDALEATIIDGTKNILEAAKEAGAKRVVFVSSALAVNGSKDPVVFDETSAFDVKDPALRYAHAKHKAEGIALEHAKNGLDVVIVNPGEVYGPEDDGFITAGNIKDILVGWPALTCRGGTAVTHVDDVAEGMILALEKGRSGERYILGGDNLSVEELVRLVLDIAAKKTPVLKLPNGIVKGLIQGMAKIHLPTPVIPEVLDYATLFWFMDSSKAKRELGYRPRSARDAIAPVIDWLHAAGHVKASRSSRPKDVPTAT
jgi:dihydroflavonol-4-reductase